MFKTLRISLLVLVVLLGSAVTASAQMGDMTAQLEPLEGNEFEIAWMEAMIAHHQSAIDMAEIALERGQREEVKTTAQAIIDEQQAEIDEMTTWLMEWHNREPMGMDHDMDMMMPEMEQLTAGPDEEFDVTFLEMMIPHHAGAIGMAELVPDRTDRPELNEVSAAIIESQTAEIEQFQTWIAGWSNEEANTEAGEEAPAEVSTDQPPTDTATEAAAGATPVTPAPATVPTTGAATTSTNSVLLILAGLTLLALGAFTLARQRGTAR